MPISVLIITFYSIKGAIFCYYSFLCSYNSYVIFVACRRLSFYPYGDQRNNGNNLISVYLVIVETDTFSSGWEFNVNFKMFLYDQINDKYLTFQGKNISFLFSFISKHIYLHTYINILIYIIDIYTRKC